MKRVVAEDYGLWELAVLSLLRERPMHPYEIQQVLQERHKDDVLALKKGSLYHAIRRLGAAELITAHATTRQGRRPERTVYRITPEGRAALKDWLRHHVAIPRPERSHFMGAVSFLVHLSPGEAAAALKERAAALQRQIAGYDATLAHRTSEVGRVNLIETEFARAMRAAELAWVRRSVAELRTGRLHWDLAVILHEVRAAAGRKKERKRTRSS